MAGTPDLDLGKIVLTDEDFNQAIQFLRESRTIALDIETKPWETAPDGQYPEMCGISTYSRIRYDGGFREAGFYFPFRHRVAELFQVDGVRNNLPLSFGTVLQKTLQAPDRTLVLHNGSYDFTCLMAHDGWEYPSNLWYDTMQGAHLINENRFSYRLEALSQELFQDEGAIKRANAFHKLVDQFGGMHKVSPLAVGQYAIGDVFRTHRLFFHHVKPQLEAQGLLDLWWPHEAKYVLELAQVTKRGVAVNREKARALATEADLGMRTIKDSLGWDPGKPSVLALKLYAAPPRGAGLPITRFSKNRQQIPFTDSAGRKITNVPIMGKNELKDLIHETPIVEQVLRYRTYQKAFSTWFQGWQDQLGPDGRIHPSFKRHGTVTGRLSSSNPNIQQLPRRSDDPEEESKYIKYRVKDMLDTTPGYELWEFDYAQAEYRLAACYGNDPHVTEALNNGQDFHTITAETLGISRFNAKTVNFAILYGAGAAKLASMLGMSEEDAKDLIMSIRSGYPGLTQSILAATLGATRDGKITLWTGRVRHLPGSNDAHKAFNSLCQGGVAGIVKHSMIKLAEEKPECPMVAQVHDSVWLEVPVEEKEQHLNEIQEILEWPGSHFPIIFPVDRKLLASRS